MYGEQNEPWAKSIPFMPGVGNHVIPLPFL